MSENPRAHSITPEAENGAGDAFADWVPGPMEREDMIRVAAYHLAQRSAFKLDPNECWAAAETQINMMFKLKESQAKLNAIVSSALDAVVMMDAKGMITGWNPRACEMFGWSENEAIGMSIEGAIIPQRYREAHRKGLEKYRATGKGEMLRKLVEIQAIDRGGREFAVELTIAPVRAEGEPEFSAFIRDISRRKRLEGIQAARIRLMEYATNHTLKQLLVATLDEAGALTESPIGFYHFLEADQNTLHLQAWSTRTTAEFCHAGGEDSHYDIDKAGVWVDAVRQRRPVIHNDYASLPHKKGLPEGHAVVLREMVVPVFRKGMIVAILGVGNKVTPYGEDDLETVTLLADLAWDFAENKRMETELREMATTDFLTGLYNRRHFMLRMEDELARLARRDDQSASVLMLDLDHFKAVNDTQGHAAGDSVLKHFAEIIRGELRKIDAGGRVGGEEFAVLLPDTDVREAGIFAERLRKKLADNPFRQEAGAVPVTVSIGVASLRAEDVHPDAALMRADNALYCAKAGGRNRVETERAV